MTDHELITRFESCTLAPEDFTHANHVRVAFLYLSQYPLLESIERFKAGLMALATSFGKADKYHETITWAYMLIIHERMARRGSKCDWPGFAASNPDLIKDGKYILSLYYRLETLNSPLARTTFLMPDNILIPHALSAK